MRLLEARVEVPGEVGRDRRLLRGDARDAVSQWLAEQHDDVNIDGETDADLILAYDREAESRGLPPWGEDVEFRDFSNVNDVRLWGEERRLLVAAMLPEVAKQIGLMELVPSADITHARDRLHRLVPHFSASLISFEQHVLSSAEAAAQGAASANFAQELPLDERPQATYYRAARLLDTLLGRLAGIDSTSNPVLVNLVSLAVSIHPRVSIRHPRGSPGLHPTACLTPTFAQRFQCVLTCYT